MAESSMETCKIVIAGPFSSGKTTFIKTLNDVGKDSTTVAMDFGRIDIDETLILYIFGVPGNRRDLWGQLVEGALGSILMIDSRYPETFRDAYYRFQETRSYQLLPIVIAANFQDSPDAWDVEALRIALRLSSDIPIVPCVVTDRKSVKGVLLALMNEVLKDVLRHSPDTEVSG